MIAIIVSLLAGLFVSGIVFRHQRMLTYLGASVALAWGWWLVLTFVSRVLVPDFSPTVLYGFGAALLAVLFLPWWRQWNLPYKNGQGSGLRDVIVIAALVPPLLAAFLVWQVNGHKDGDWVWHGFFNGDTATFASLVEKSFHTSQLVTDNPFGAGVKLEYPTLLHAGVAGLFLGSETNGWIHFLPTMTYVAIFVTVTSLFLLFDTVFPESLQPGWLGLKRVWVTLLPLIGVLYVMAVGWDNFIYPQSHFFLFGLWLTVACLFWQGLKNMGSLRWVTLLLASIFTCVLIGANAVVGAAALAVALGVFGSMMLDKKNTAALRVACLIICIAFIGIFLGFAPGEPQFGGLQFSYGAAGDMMHLLPALGLLLMGLALYENRPANLLLGVAGLCALAGVTFFFSNRDIVVANASRFLYHAVLVGWPFMVTPVVRLGFWLKRSFFYSTKTLPELIGGSILIVTFFGLLLLPAAASVAQAHDNLMRKDKQVVSSAMVEAMWWLEDHTNTNNVIVASPLPPWYIPFFTGRTLLRAAYKDGSAYWLSAQDDVLTTQISAFKGDKKAQQEIVTKADYLLLQGGERLMWEPLAFEKTFDNQETVIYRLTNGI